MKRIYQFRLTVFLFTSFIMSACAFAQENSPEQLIEKLKTYDFGSGLKEITAMQQVVIESLNNPEAQKSLASGLAGLLETDAPYGCKQFVCRQLAIIGTGREVPVLAKYLLDEEMSGMALYALARIDQPVVDQYLREALGRATGRIRVGIINTIGRRRDRDAVNQLSFLLQGSDENAVGAAAEALSAIGGGTAARALRNALSTAEGNLRTVLADACLRCADNFLAESDKSAAEDMYTVLYSNMSESYIKAAALKGLLQAGNPETGLKVFTALQDGDFALQKAVVSLVSLIPGKENTKKFAKLLPQLPEQTQVMLLSSLREKGDNAALPWVEKACGSTDPHVRTAALKAIGAIGNASHVALLAERAANGGLAEKEAARESLILLRDPGVDDQILTLLEKSEANIQIELIDCLPARQITGASDVLFKIVEQGNRGSRRAAIKAIGASAHANYIRRFIDLTLTIEGSDRDNAEIAAAEIIRRTNAESISIPLLLEKYETTGVPERKRSIIRILAKIGDDRSLPLLRASLNDSDGEIRTEAIRGLNVWQNAEPLKDLLIIAQEEKDQTQRILALRGVIDLVEKDPASTQNEKLRLYQRAMSLAGQDAEKRRVLAKMGTMGSFEALNVVMRYLDGTTTEEAAAAAFQIALRVYRDNLGLAGIMMDEIIQKSRNETVLGDARMLKSGIQRGQWRNIERELEKTEPVSLFDGGSFKGWEGNREIFRIEDGAIVAGWLDKDIPRNEFLCTEKKYRDFELRLKFKLTGSRADANAGVQFRSERIPNHNEVKGYQADIGQNYWGSLYDESRRKKILAQADMNALKDVIKYDDWNEYVILCVGNSVVLSLNGLQTVDYNESDDSIEQDGIIGLQIHVGPPSEIRYKDVTIKELKRDVPFRLHEINADSPFEAATVLDINNDGNLDIFCGGFWYEAPEWEKHFVREVPETGGYHVDFAAIPYDVDRDGWLDVINGSWHHKNVFWVRNPGKSMEPFEVIRIDEPGNLETAIGIDISGDGQLDILPNTVGSLVWYEYQEDRNAPHGVKWIKHELQKEAAGHGVGAGDINGDGRVDIITPKGWLEHPLLLKDRWIWHKDFSLGTPSVPVLAHDPDQDGDMDIIWGMGHGYGIYWLEQERGTSGQRAWKKHEIDNSWSQPHFFILADLDNDGQKEFITGKRYHAHNGHDPGGEHPLCVYYYKYDQGIKNWTRHVLHEGGRVGFGIYTAAADIDKDGDVDIVAPGKSGLYLFENMLR